MFDDHGWEEVKTGEIDSEKIKNELERREDSVQ